MDKYLCFIIFDFKFALCFLSSKSRSYYICFFFIQMKIQDKISIKQFLMFSSIGDRSTDVIPSVKLIESQKWDEPLRLRPPGQHASSPLTNWLVQSATEKGSKSSGILALSALGYSRDTLIWNALHARSQQTSYRGKNYANYGA